MNLPKLIPLLIFVVVNPSPKQVLAAVSTRNKQISKSIFKQLIEIDTTNSTTAAAEAMAKRFLECRFPRERYCRSIGPNDLRKESGRPIPRKRPTQADSADRPS